jgi:hypothetical protein
MLNFSYLFGWNYNQIKKTDDFDCLSFTAFSDIRPLAVINCLDDNVQIKY